jgi:hypothetical protein
MQRFRSAEDKARVVKALRELADKLENETQDHSELVPKLVRPALKPGDRVRIVDYLDYAHKDKKSTMVLEVLPHGKRMRVVEIDGQEARAPLPVGLAYDVPVTQAHWDELVKQIKLERVSDAGD